MTTDFFSNVNGQEVACISEPQGDTYEPRRDKARLNRQYLRVWTLMSDGKARTLREIEDATGDPQASISARLREIGVEKKRKGDSGTWEYRFTV